MFQHQGSIFRESEVQVQAQVPKQQSWYYDNKMLKLKNYEFRIDVR